MNGAEWLAKRFRLDAPILAQRAFRDVNEYAKTVDAARALATYLVKVADQKAAPHPHLITNGFRITFGAVALTLRRFEDDWSDYISHLFTKAQRPGEALALLAEMKARKLRDAANLLVAHSAPQKQAPLSTEERMQKVINGGWKTEEELVEWYPPVALKLLAVRDAIAKVWPGAERGAQALSQSEQLTDEQINSRRLSK